MDAAFGVGVAAGAALLEPGAHQCRREGADVVTGGAPEDAVGGIVGSLS